MVQHEKLVIVLIGTDQSLPIPGGALPGVLEAAMERSFASMSGQPAGRLQHDVGLGILSIPVELHPDDFRTGCAFLQQLNELCVRYYQSLLYIQDPSETMIDVTYEFANLSVTVDGRPKTRGELRLYRGDEDTPVKTWSLIKNPNYKLEPGEKNRLLNRMKKYCDTHKYHVTGERPRKPAKIKIA